jgi:uncharacterized membrane protein HdeD (DUF308 family)
VSERIERGSPNRTIAWGVLSFGIVALVIGIVFIATKHDLRATASFIVGVVALIGGWFLVKRNPTIT